MAEEDVVREVSDSPSTRFYELRGLFTNAIGWSFWGKNEEEVITVPKEQVDKARAAAERCIRDLEEVKKDRMNESNLVQHAKRELELLGEEKEMIDWYLEVVLAFISYGHSGGSASVAIPTLNKLLQFQNLTPLTNDPHEWNKVGENLWQSARNSAAFSDDGGKTYCLVSDRNRLKLTYASVDPSKIDEQ